MLPIRTILCPVDFSAPSEEAVRYAVSFAERVGAETVHLLHVLQRPSYPIPDIGLFPEEGVEGTLRTHLSRELEAMAHRFSTHGVDVVTHLVDGLPHRAIVEHAKKLDAQLVVMGTHGRSGLTHLFLGSVAEKVVRESGVPVCTVRAPEE